MSLLTTGRAAPPSAPSVADLDCPACGGAGRRLRLVVDPGCALVECAGCRTQYLRRLSLPPGGAAGPAASGEVPDADPGGGTDGNTDSEYWEQYKFAVYDSDDVRRGYDERYDLAFGMLRDRLGPVATVLDIGCGVGNFLDWARRHGLRAVGVDVEPRAVAVARERGLSAAVPEELDAVLGDGATVDVLTLWDVIEHVFDVQGFLGRFAGRVAPGGALLLETPDAAFPVRGVFRGLHGLTGGRVDLVGSMYYWEHKVYFTEEGLRRLLTAHGYEVLEVRRLTSPRAKMAHTFSHDLEQDRSLGSRLLAGAWPMAESAFRRLGRGNKLVLLARRVADGVPPATAG